MMIQRVGFSFRKPGSFHPTSPAWGHRSGCTGVHPGWATSVIRDGPDMMRGGRGGSRSILHCQLMGRGSEVCPLEPASPPFANPSPCNHDVFMEKLCVSQAPRLWGRRCGAVNPLGSGLVKCFYRKASFRAKENPVTSGPIWMWSSCGP